MPANIQHFESVVIQIATPYTTGTGFLLPQFGLIVTNEHVIRDNRDAVIEGANVQRQVVRILFCDIRLDIAFLEAKDLPEVPSVQIKTDAAPQTGERVYAVGHPFGLRFTTTSGIISNPEHHSDGIVFIQHDAALNPGNSGGPLIDDEGNIIGINTFIIQNGQNIGFSLPIRYVADAALKYQEKHGVPAVACYGCGSIVFDTGKAMKYCPNCGAAITLPNYAEPYEPIGMAATIEQLITATGHDVHVSRRGPNAWELQHGSAKIALYYYEKTGLITGEAYLCSLPGQNIKEVYQYLLHENYHLAGLTLSVRQQDIILSLLIYDRYLNLETGLRLLEQLFTQADAYDNILVEQFGAAWRHPNE